MAVHLRRISAPDPEIHRWHPSPLDRAARAAAGVLLPHREVPRRTRTVVHSLRALANASAPLLPARGAALFWLPPAAPTTMILCGPVLWRSDRRRSTRKTDSSEASPGPDRPQATR